MKFKKETENKSRENKLICKGDKVYITTGNDRGQVGTVVSHMGDRVLVQGLNLRKKCMKKSEMYPNGAIIDREAPLHISNVKLCIAEDKAVKVKVKVDANGERQLVYKDGDQEVVYRQIKKRTK